ncbi:MAG: phosphotransferase [Pantoea sp. Pent]|nr:phosphotransferase [Pantoea sp. Pent]
MHNPDPRLQHLVQQQWPTAQAAGHFFARPGLSGNSVQVRSEQGYLLARRTPSQPIPFVDRQREYRILRQLRATALAAGRGAVAGAVQRAAVLTLLLRLHHQPLTGYRLRLTPLLQRYWQLCQQRHWRWQQRLNQLLQRGEPSPLRLAPLHMDVHPGNLIATPDGLRLIDWEYAADGDVALALAAVGAVDGAQHDHWITDYAAEARLSATALRRQSRRWQPWLQLLMASWYQLRAEQSHDQTLQWLAQASWQDL